MKLPISFDVLIFICDNKDCTKNDIRNKHMLTTRQFDDIISDLMKNWLIKSINGRYSITSRGKEVYKAVVNLRLELQC